MFEHTLKQKLVSAVTLVVWRQALQQRRDFNGALNTLSIADSLAIAPVPSHYAVLLSSATEMSNLTAVKQIHKHLNNHPTGKDQLTTSILVRGYAQCGDVQSGLAVFDDGLQRGVAFDVTAWNGLASAFVARGMVQEAQAILERMTTSAAIKPDGVTLLLWSQIFRQRKSLVGALDTLSIADSLGILPEPAHYTVLLSCASEMSDLTATKHIHQHLSNHPTAKNNDIVLNSLVQNYSQCGDFETATAVFEHALKLKQVNAVTLAVWCQALQHHNDLNGALHTLSIADSLAILPTPSHYTVLLTCAAEMKNLEATKHIHEHLSKHPTAKKDGPPIMC